MNGRKIYDLMDQVVPMNVKTLVVVITLAGLIWAAWEPGQRYLAKREMDAASDRYDSEFLSHAQLTENFGTESSGPLSAAQVDIRMVLNDITLDAAREFKRRCDAAKTKPGYYSILSGKCFFNLIDQDIAIMEAYGARLAGAQRSSGEENDAALDELLDRVTNPNRSEEQQ